MIRFCDREVNCFEIGKIKRQELLTYFEDRGVSDSVCVDDASGKFLGMITYDSLLDNDDINDAILRKYVTLSESNWQGIRYYFSNPNINKYELIPVVDMKGQLICFAYEDEWANREIRMLRELMEVPEALQFSNIYPNYQCVRIYDFNELAFYFAKYLESQGITVQVYGALWKYMNRKAENSEFLEYQCMSIYAEGTIPKPIDWRKNLLRTVSVEFECIDKIYEANLKKGIIKNTRGDFNGLFEWLRDEKEIVILGTGMESQDAYDALSEKEIYVSCFVDDGQGIDTHKLFGKSILDDFEAMNKYRNPIFIDCVSQNSSWGGGKLEYYDYLGYERNKQIFFLKDYIKIEGKCLIKSVSATKTFLAGDVHLCKYLYDYYKRNMVVIEGYLDIEGKEDEIEELPRIEADSIDSGMMCLIVIPEYFTPRNLQLEAMNRVVTYLKENGIDNYSNYFSYALPFIRLEGLSSVRYTKGRLKPKRIVLGSIEGCCGNVFFRSLLDGHPSIMMTNYNHVNDTLLNDNLFLLCIRLSTEKSENILAFFWRIYEAEGRDEICDKKVFNQKMSELLRSGSTFTPQELFVMFHIAYKSILGYDMDAADVEDMVIYWEPHFMGRGILEECVTCLGSEEVFCDIINLVRNICMRNGAVAKGYISMGWLGDREIAYNAVLDYPLIEKKDYGIDKRLVIRFEDLKCSPVEILMKICRRWNITWSDSLMRTTNNGKSSTYDNGEREVKDFDLGPVYNTYEKYFSEFDRLRIMIINAPWQRKYGYPYERISGFSSRDLQEMFMKEFRFEKMIEYSGTESDIVMHYRRQTVVRNRLLKIRLLELLEEN